MALGEIEKEGKLESFVYLRALMSILSGMQKVGTANSYTPHINPKYKINEEQDPSANQTFKGK